MDPTCSWHCKATTTTNNPENVTTTASKTTTTNNPDDKYCEHGTDMYMQGFAVSTRIIFIMYYDRFTVYFELQLGSNGKNPCIILLFNSWTLDSRAKFIFGCIGVVFLGK